MINKTQRELYKDCPYWSGVDNNGYIFECLLTGKACNGKCGYKHRNIIKRILFKIKCKLSKV